MHDPRFDTLARLMLNHSLQIKAGEAFNINADTRAIPLVKAILKQAREVGAFANVDLTDQEVTRHLLGLVHPEDGGLSQAYLDRKAAWNLAKFESMKGEISIRSYANDQELSAIAPDVRRLEAQCAKPFRDLVINHRRWVLFEYPTAAQAQRAGMAYDDYFDFVLAVSCVDYAQMQRDVIPLADRMRQAKAVRITGPGTDLQFSIENIPAIPCCGEYNIPDGECFTAPVLHSVEGVIQYNAPSIYWGTTFNNIRFEFHEGKIVHATAVQHTVKLNQILDSDPGARYLGEFALAFNPLIQKPFCNTLFDEKIAGSFHLTPGSCYDEAPNGNDSTIHWDLVCIQRPEFGGGEIWFDEELIRKDGLFIPADLQALNP